MAKRRAVRASRHDRSGLPAAPMPARTPAGNALRSTVVARGTPTPASGAAFTGRAGQIRRPIRSSGSRAYGDHAHRQVGGEAQEPQGARSCGLLAVGTDGEFDQGGVGHGGARRAVPLDDRRRAAMASRSRSTDRAARGGGAARAG
ncbi:hypothetical protein GT038_00605 [Streptomyces sp. SID337]|nr:hypothetical protein [Streptomyces sp. SID337]